MKELTKEEKARKEEILNSLKNWGDKPDARSGEPFRTFFARHTQFSFTCYYHETTCVTVYFGLKLDSNGDQEIVAHVIPEYQDDSELAYNHVLTCPAKITGPLTKTQSLTFMGPIDRKEAVQRIRRWEKSGKDWMENYQGDFFKAISIPVDDFNQKENSFTVYFALKRVRKQRNKIKTIRLDFDLILQREGETVYLDTVHLIPPLKPPKAYILDQISAKTTSRKHELRTA